MFLSFRFSTLRSFLSFLLSFSLFFAPTLSGFSPLAADENDQALNRNNAQVSASLTQEAPEGISIEGLDEYLRGETLDHPADYFLTIRQSVPGVYANSTARLEELRQEELRSLEKAIEQDSLKSHPQLAEDELRGVDPSNKNEDASAESLKNIHDPYTKMIVEQSSNARLEREVKLEERALNNLKIKDLTLRLLDGQNRVLEELPFHRFRGQKNTNFSQTKCEAFELLYQGKVVNYFDLPVESIAIHNERMFFKRPGAVDISFIDLPGLKRDIGRAALPVYRLAGIDLESSLASPVPGGNGFSVQGGKLYLGDYHVKDEDINVFKPFQENAWNATVGLFDSAVQSDLSEAMPSFQEYWQHGRDTALASEITPQFPDLPVSKGIDGYFDRLQKSLENTSVLSGLDKKNSIRETLAKNVEPWLAHRAYKSGLFVRISYLWGRLSLPKPQGAHTVRSALAALAAKTQYRGQLKEGRQYREALLRIANNRYAKILGSVGMVAVATWAFPESTKSVALGAAHTMHNLALLTMESCRSIVAGFDPLAFNRAYLADGKRQRFAHGLTAVVTLLAAVTFVPIAMVNSYKFIKRAPERFAHEGRTYRDFYESIARERRVSDIPAFIRKSALDVVKFAPRLRKAFVEQQDFEAKEIAENQVKAEARRAGRDAKTDWTPAEEAEVRRIAEGLWKESFGKDKKGKKFSPDIKTLRQALYNFLGGDSAFNNLQDFSIPAWNIWFGTRSFWKNPTLLLTMAYYPNFYGRTIPRPTEVSDDLPEARAASFWNGGLRPIYEQVFHALRGIPFREAKVQLDNFERKVADLELGVQRVILKNAFEAMAEDLTDSDELHKLFAIEGGMRKISQPDLLNLKGQGRAYFAAYYHKAYEASMRAILGEELYRKKVREDEVPPNVHELSRRKLKKLAAQNIDRFSLQPEEIEELVKVATNESGARGAACRSAETAEEHAFASLLYNKARLFRLSQINRLASTQAVKRMQISNMLLVDPVGRARAVRSTKNMLLVDKPMELAMTLILLSNVEEGMLKPMHDEMHGANSWHYMSRYVFINAAISLFMSIHGGVWMKAQMDFRQKDELGIRPTGPDAQNSFLRQYIRKLTRNPNNSLWKNHIANSEIILANMPAAFVTFAMMDAISLNRFDLDYFTTSYLLAYLVPIYSSLEFTADQAFESAAFHDARHIPPKYMDHPIMQMALNEVAMRRRTQFNLAKNSLFNVYNLFWSKLQFLKVDGIGPRAAARIVGGGYTPTEHVNNHVVDPIVRSVRWVTGGRVDPADVAKKCMKILTNNYTDGVKLKPPGS